MYISSEQKYAYKLLHDAYYGSGLFSLGRGLKQHPRESLDNYNFRKMLSSYSNHIAPIVNANVDPIFNDEIRREYNSTAKFDVFLKNADRLGTSLQEYIQQQAMTAKLYAKALPSAGPRQPGRADSVPPWDKHSRTLRPFAI